MINMLAKIASRTVESARKSTLLNPRAFKVRYSSARGTIDRITVEYAGAVIVEGNYSIGKIDPADVPDCFIDGHQVVLTQSYFTEPEIVHNTYTKTPESEVLPRLAHLYQVPMDFPSAVHRIELKIGSKKIFSGRSFFHTVVPAYNVFYNTPDVLNRDHVYTVGPPSDIFTPAVIRIAKTLTSPVLDFGAGTGGLVRIMRDNGQDARGIEVESDRIKEHILPEIKEYIKLYDGSFPLPYETGEFSSVVASGVLEHIPSFEEATKELTRITSGKLILTVPDMTAVPLCAPYCMVPWHLMESTHFHFFNPNSLAALLEKFFDTVVIAKIDSSRMNGVKWYQLIMAICTEKKTF